MPMTSTDINEKDHLVSLLLKCALHLENSDDYAPIFSQTLNGLLEHMSHQGQIIHTQWEKLQQERNTCKKEVTTNPEVTVTTKPISEDPVTLELQQHDAALKRRQKIIEQMQLFEADTARRRLLWGHW